LLLIKIFWTLLPIELDNSAFVNTNLFLLSALVLQVFALISLVRLFFDKNMHVFINEVDVTERLTEPDVSRGSSIVAAIPTVRPVMVRMQQEFAKTQSVVMEGRDIGLRVLPNAPLKIYLTASLTERAKRRWIQWHKNGIDKTLDETIEETRQRDKLDQERTVDPLQILPDAWVLDTTGMTQDDVVNAIIKQLQERSLV
jgi:cytidylate kinase